MKIEYLIEFVVLAETRNFQEAAANLFIAQASLSKHIQTIEQELGVSLFDRTTRSVHLSREGELFLPYASKIAQLHEEYSHVLKIRSVSESKKVTIASTSQMVQYNVTDALAQFKRQHLACTLDVLIEPHSNLKRLLTQRKTDFVWIGEPADDPPDDIFERLPFLSEPLVALFSQSSPLFSRESVSIDELRGFEFVMQDNSSIEQAVFLKFCRRAGFSPSILSIPGGGVLVDFVKRGLGPAIMLKTPARNVCCPEVRIAVIEGSPIVNVNLLYLKNARFSLSAKSFLQYFENLALEGAV